MTESRRPRVLLADDYAGMLAALQRMLAVDCDVVGSVRDGMSLLEAAARLRPDVIVLDLNLPEVNGLDACRQITRTIPETRIVVLTAVDHDAVRDRALGLGASAFLAKHLAASHLLPAIHEACAGRL